MKHKLTKFGPKSCKHANIDDITISGQSLIRISRQNVGQNVWLFGALARGTGLVSACLLLSI